MSTKDSNLKRIDRVQGNLSGSIHNLSKVRNMEVAHKIMLRPGQLNLWWIKVGLPHDESMCYLLIFYNSLRLSLVVLVIYFHSQVPLLSLKKS